MYGHEVYKRHIFSQEDWLQKVIENKIQLSVVLLFKSGVLPIAIHTCTICLEAVICIRSSHAFLAVWHSAAESLTRDICLIVSPHTLFMLSDLICTPMLFCIYLHPPHHSMNSFITILYYIQPSTSLLFHFWASSHGRANVRIWTNRAKTQRWLSL